MTKPDSRALEPSWQLSELLARAGVAAERGGIRSDVTVASLTDDTRKIVPGTCFVAIRGSVSDGHELVDTAARRGAASGGSFCRWPNCVSRACTHHSPL